MNEGRGMWRMVMITAKLPLSKARELRSGKGFTLIEILVAISIFVVLTGLAVVNYQSFNRRARDGRRMADLEEVRAKLEIYRADNARYPFGAGVGANYSEMTATLLSGNYLTVVPADPRGYSYYYSSTDGTTYSLCAYLERGGTANCGNNCSAPGNCNYRTQSP